jgi:predicted translin family RNA/ssDNA-binding protein
MSFLGVQEYIEAKTFHHYMRHNGIPDWVEVQKDLTYPAEGEEEEFRLPLVPTEYMLGLGDLTGELMRRCINCVGTGHLDTCREVCVFMRHIYKGFAGVNCPGCREMGRKVYTLRQSLLKTENACYTIHVRGSEVPQHLLAQALTMNPEEHDEDEGFY